jgi:hypothetical protein
MFGTTVELLSAVHMFGTTVELLSIKHVFGNTVELLCTVHVFRNVSAEPLFFISKNVNLLENGPD